MSGTLGRMPHRGGATGGSPVTPGRTGGRSPHAAEPGGASVTRLDPSRRPAHPDRDRRGRRDHPSARARPASGPVSLFAGMPLGEIAERAGLRRIDVLAWRDFDDPEAGGSELHAHRVISAWSAAGLDVSMTTSSVPGGRQVVRRDGYRVIRRAGRYSVFPRSILSGAVGRIGTGDGVVEIWNGMPFFSPLWSRSPQITFLHHVHAEMWKMVLPRGLAEFGHLRSSTGSPRPSTAAVGSSPSPSRPRPRSSNASTCRPTGSP